MEEIIFPDEPIKIGNDFYLPHPYSIYWWFGKQHEWYAYWNYSPTFGFGFTGF
jgi:hypothetical protein